MRFVSALIAALTMFASATDTPLAAQASAATESLKPVLWQPSMNVFRRFAADRAKIINFYGDALGLKPERPIAMPGGGQMTQFGVGTALVKLTTVTRNGSYTGGDIRAVTGLRLITFFFPDETALKARLAANGYPVPEFKPGAGGRKIALTTDPDGQWVELVVMPAGTPASAFENIEVGLTVSDIEKSRAFYRDFVNLEELKPVEDELLHTTKYPFRHGTFTINLWSFGKGLPQNTGSAGIQYVVSNVDAVDAKAKATGQKIDTPLGNTMGTLRTVWLSDPDNITNYFAETAQSRAARTTN